MDALPALLIVKLLLAISWYKVYKTAPYDIERHFVNDFSYFLIFLLSAFHCAPLPLCALRIQGLYLLLLFLKQIKEDTMYVCYFIWPRPPHIHTLPNCVNRYVQLYVCLTKKNTKQNTTHMQYIRQRIHEHPLG